MMKFEFIDSTHILNKRTNSIFKLDSIAKNFLKIYFLTETKEEAVQKLAEFYSIDKNKIKHDFLDFIDTIEGNKPTKLGSLPKDHYVVLEPTNDCDAHCIHCFHSFHKKYSWSVKTIDEKVNILKKNGIKSVSLTGGEVFSPHYIENTKYLITKLNKEKINIISISTNGIFLTNKLMKWLDDNIDLEKLIFRISLDTLDSNILNLRPGYKEVYSVTFWDLLEQYSANIIVTTVLYRQAIEEVIKIADYLKTKKNILRWIVKPMVVTKAKQNNIKKNYQEEMLIYKNILSWYKNNKDIRFDFLIGNSISKGMLDNPEKNIEISLWDHPCREEKNQRTIKSNGSFTRCPIISELGNQFSLNIERLSESSQELFDNLTINEMKCANCKYYKLCGGGCRLFAISATGSYYECDPHSRFFWDWVTNSDFLKNEFKDFYTMVKDMVE